MQQLHQVEKGMRGLRSAIDLQETGRYLGGVRPKPTWQCINAVNAYGRSPLWWVWYEFRTSSEFINGITPAHAGSQIDRYVEHGPRPLSYRQRTPSE